LPWHVRILFSPRDKAGSSRSSVSPRRFRDSQRISLQRARARTHTYIHIHTHMYVRVISPSFRNIRWRGKVVEGETYLAGSANSPPCLPQLHARRMCFQHTIVNTFYFLGVYGTSSIRLPLKSRRVGPAFASSRLRSKREPTRTDNALDERTEARLAPRGFGKLPSASIPELHPLALDFHVTRVCDFFRPSLASSLVAKCTWRTPRISRGCLMVLRPGDEPSRLRGEDAEWFVNAVHYGLLSSLALRGRLPGAFARADEDLDTACNLP
jgi:hypothetical protein